MPALANAICTQTGLVLGKNESWCTAVQASGGIAAKAAK